MFFTGKFYAKIVSLLFTLNLLINLIVYTRD
jgi:hypothetical protein